jgi:WD40 repeat protein
MVSRVAFSPDGKLLATAGSDSLIRFWDTATYREIGKMKGAWPIVFSPDGKELVSSVGEGTLAIRKLAEAIPR